MRVTFRARPGGTRLTVSAELHRATLAPQLTARELDLSTLSDAQLVDWRDLTQQSGSGAFFASPMFVRTFASVFSDRTSISILCFYDTENKMRGLVPLMRNRVRRGPSFNTRYSYQDADYDLLQAPPPKLPLPAAQLSTPLGLEPTALRSEILAAPEMYQTIVKAIPAAIADLNGWNLGVFVLDDDDCSAFAQGPLRTLKRPLDRNLKFVSKVQPADAFVALQNQKFRQNVRRSVKFSKNAGATFEIIRGAEDVLPAMIEFDDLARRSWKNIKNGGRAVSEEVLIPFNARQNQFFISLIQLDEAEPVMVAARIDGVMISAMLMSLHCNRLLTFLIYSDVEHARLGIGRLTLHTAIDFAHAEGVDEIDYNSNASWTIPYSDRVSKRSNMIFTAPSLAGRWRHELAKRLAHD